MTDPESSLAVICMIGAVLAALVGGTPDKVRIGPSRLSQLGAFDNVYSKDEEEEKVDAEKVNVNGIKTRATGGT